MREHSAGISIVALNAEGMLRTAREVHAGTHRGAIPISLERAACMVKNPDARPDDVLLLLAKNDSGLTVGYTGLMPGRIVFQGKSLPMAWFSTGFIAPRYRGKEHRLGELLGAAAESHYDILAGNDMTPLAAGVYRRRGFLELAGPEVVKFPMTWLNPRLAWSKWTGGRLNRREGQHAALPTGAVFVDALDSGSWSDRNKTDEIRFLRGPANLQWLLKTPWFPSPRRTNANEEGYFFLHPGKTVEFRCIEWRAPSGAIEGGLVLSLVVERGSRLVKILDGFGKGEAGNSAAFRCAVSVAQALNADFLIGPIDFFSGSWLGRALLPVSRTRRIPFYFHAKDKEILRCSPRIALSPSDGDLPHW